MVIAKLATTCFLMPIQLKKIQPVTICNHLTAFFKQKTFVNLVTTLAEENSEYPNFLTTRFFKFTHKTPIKFLIHHLNSGVECSKTSLYFTIYFITSHIFLISQTYYVLNLSTAGNFSP